jgi:hypothetical protein
MGYKPAKNIVSTAAGSFTADEAKAKQRRADGETAASPIGRVEAATVPVDSTGRDGR